MDRYVIFLGSLGSVVVACTLNGVQDQLIAGNSPEQSLIKHGHPYPVYGTAQIIPAVIIASSCAHHTIDLRSPEPQRKNRTQQKIALLPPYNNDTECVLEAAIDIQSSVAINNSQDKFGEDTPCDKAKRIALVTGMATIVTGLLGGVGYGAVALAQQCGWI
jgi:hypothetical protein